MFGCPTGNPKSTCPPLNSSCSSQDLSPLSFTQRAAQASNLNIILSLTFSFASTFNQPSYSDRSAFIKWLKIHPCLQLLCHHLVQNIIIGLLDYCNSPIQSGISKMQIWPWHSCLNPPVATPTLRIQSKCFIVACKTPLHDLILVTSPSSVLCGPLYTVF